MTQYYLKTNAIAEPLVNQWYAWPMLISPATYALILQNAHLLIMESYIRMPRMHSEASKNARMRGGPFIDFSGEEKVIEVKQLVAEINQQCQSILTLATALKELNQLVLSQTDGCSLIPLYEKIPAALKGYVELIYDANHHPGFRLIESLLYRSEFYNESRQSLMLSSLTCDYRSFVLSTPRLTFNNELIWTIPFRDPLLNEFFATRTHAREKKYLTNIFENHFENTEHNHDLFWSLFSEQSDVQTHSPVAENKIRIRYFGHASVLIETHQTSILIDAMASYSYPTDIKRYTYADLPPSIDYVILTHSHQDHVLLEHLIQLRYKIKNIVVPKNSPGAIQDPSLKLMFKHLNFPSVIELGEMDSVSLPEGEIIGIPFFGEHGDLYIQSKMAYVIRLHHKNILFAADSNNLEPMLYAHLQKEIPHFDVIFLGMECEGAPMSWLYGPLMGKPLSRTMDQSRRLNGSDCEKAMDIIRRFDCKQIYIYAMGQEPWLGYITSIAYTESSMPLIESDKLIAQCLDEGRNASRPYAMMEIHL